MKRGFSAVFALSYWLSVIGGLMILVSAAMISLDVLWRYMAGSTILESFEISRYLFAVAVALSFSYAALDKAHIRIDILCSIVPRWLLTVMNLLAILSLAAVALLLCWRGWEVFTHSLAVSAHSRSQLATPLALPQGLWMVGLGWFALLTVCLALAAGSLLVRRRITDLNKLIGPASGIDEIERVPVTSVDSDDREEEVQPWSTSDT